MISKFKTINSISNYFTLNNVILSSDSNIKWAKYYSLIQRFFNSILINYYKNPMQEYRVDNYNIEIYLVGSKVN